MFFFVCFSLTLTFLSRECSFLFCQECLGSTGPVVTSSRLAMWAGQARQQEHICFSNLLTLVCVHSYRSCCLSRQKGFAFIFFLSCYGLWRSPICQDCIGISILLFLKLHFLSSNILKAYFSFNACVEKLPYDMISANEVDYFDELILNDLNFNTFSWKT
jgi:hypothetical protein